MKSVIVFAMSFFLFATVLGANVDVDFFRVYEESTAMRLFEREKKYEEAQKAFEELAATAQSKEETAKWRCWAAIALGRQDDRYEEAMRAARAIEGPYSAYAQLEIMTANGKHEALVEALKDENIADWPNGIRDKGHYLRGLACARAGKEHRVAIQDLASVVERVDPNARMWVNGVNVLASLYRKAGEDDKALETYRDAFAVYDEGLRWRGGSYHGRAVMGAAAILIDQEKHAEAVDVLTSHDIKSKSTGYRVLELAGDVYLDMGEKDKAVETYRAAAERAAAYKASMQKRIEEKLKAIEGEE